MKNSTLERAATPASGCQKTLQGGSEGRSPPSCIPNSRCLPQIFDLEKASRARAGQAARFQRAACLADMCGGFGSLAQQGFPARFPGRAESAGETRSVGKDRRRRAFSTSWSGRQRPLLYLHMNGNRQPLRLTGFFRDAIVWVYPYKYIAGGAYEDAGAKNGSCSGVGGLLIGNYAAGHLRRGAGGEYL